MYKLKLFTVYISTSLNTNYIQYMESNEDIRNKTVRAILFEMLVHSNMTNSLFESFDYYQY